MDEMKQVIRSLTGEQDQVLRAAYDELKKKEVYSVRIGKMPKKDSGIEINGLIYAVEYVDIKRGKVHLQLLGEKPAEVVEERIATV